MKIFKYSLEITDTQLIEIHDCAKILTVQMQNGKPFLWALVDEAQPKIQRIIKTFGTGHPIDRPSPKRYIGTYQTENFVFHVFDGLEVIK